MSGQDRWHIQQDAIERLLERLDDDKEYDDDWENMICYFRNEEQNDIDMGYVFYRLDRAEKLREWATETLNTRPAAHKEAEMMLDLADEIEANIIHLYQALSEITRESIHY